MRIIRIVAPWLLLPFFTGPWADAQDTPPSFEVFAEGGGSFLNNGTGQPPIYCIPEIECPTTATSSFSKTGRLFTGARLRFTRHGALEASYSFSPNNFSLQWSLCDNSVLSVIPRSPDLIGTRRNLALR